MPLCPAATPAAPRTMPKVLSCSFVMRYFSSASVAASSSCAEAPANSGCLAMAVSISSRNDCTSWLSGSGEGARWRRSFMNLAVGGGLRVGCRGMGRGWHCTQVSTMHCRSTAVLTKPSSTHSRVDATNQVLGLITVHDLQEPAKRQRRGRGAIVHFWVGTWVAQARFRLFRPPRSASLLLFSRQQRRFVSRSILRSDSRCFHAGVLSWCSQIAERTVGLYE